MVLSFVAVFTIYALPQYNRVVKVNDVTDLLLDTKQNEIMIQVGSYLAVHVRPNKTHAAEHEHIITKFESITYHYHLDFIYACGCINRFCYEKKPIHSYRGIRKLQSRVEKSTVQ